MFYEILCIDTLLYEVSIDIKCTYSVFLFTIHQLTLFIIHNITLQTVVYGHDYIVNIFVLIFKNTLR